MANRTIDGIIKRTLTDEETSRTRDYYIGTLRSDIVRDLTFVPVIEASKRTYLTERTEEGYQRGASVTRMNQFARFLAENPLAVVPPVVLSGRNKWVFEGDTTGRLLVEEPAAIIDGQHRMGGFVRLFDLANHTRGIDFVLLPSLSRQDEIDEFLAINNTQKGVPKPLTTFLEGEEEAVIGWELNLREDSPFHGRISRQTMRRETLFNLSSVAKNIRRTFAHGAFAGTEIDQKVDILMRYWTMIADAFPDEWADGDRPRTEFEYKLLELTGFIAWSLTGQDILGPAYDPETRMMDWNAVEAKVRKLAQSQCVDWLKNGEFYGLTGEVGGSKIHKKLQYCLQLPGD